MIIAYTKQQERIDESKKDCQAYCVGCHHTITFENHREYAICSYCGTKNRNTTRSHFKTMFYKLKDKSDYKVTKM